MKKIGALLIIILGIMTSTTQTVSASTTQSDNNNDFGIVIDGQFDDWSDKPITQLSTNGDNYDIKQASLLADSKYIYFYLDMASYNSSGYNTLQTSGYEVDIQGQQIWLTFGNTISGGNEKINTTQNINVTGWNQTNNANYNMSGTKAIETRVPTKNSYSDKVEMAIPYVDLGLAANIDQTITINVKNGNLGTQTITTTGGSTGPIVLSGIGVVTAIAGFIMYQRKRKQHTVLKQDEVK